MPFNKWFKKKPATVESSVPYSDSQVHINGGKIPSDCQAAINGGSSDKINGNVVQQLELTNGHHHTNYESHSNDHLPLETQLLLVGDDQPRVARSTPRGQMINTSRWSQEREMAYCLYDRPVYDAMIESSLKTVEMLQENLDCFVTEVRKSPSRAMTPPPPPPQTTSLVNGKSGGKK